MSLIDDVDAVAGARARVESGHTLHRSWYLDPAVYEAEREAVFQRSWQYVAHQDELARPGDYVVAPVGDFTVLVVRGKDGVLRAFHNTCQHRGHELAACSGSTRVFRCPYHAWSYGLDGSLLNAPFMRGAPGFDRSQVRLQELRVDAWECFVFVSCDPEPPTLADWLGPLAARTTAMDLDFGALTRFRRIEYDVAANWKIVVENSLECYHCHVAHPELVDLLDMSLFVQEVSENGVAMGGPVAQDVRREVSMGADYEYPDGGVREGQYLYTWPSFYFLVYPGPGNVSNLRFYPRGVDRTLVVREFYFSDAVDEQSRTTLSDFVDNIQNQDTGLCESVQRGLRAGGFTEGRLQLVNNIGEYGPQQFYRRYLDQMLGHAEASAARTGSP
jgi:phenylpropionate dioxygenase-like ring-hydroxylating dioxygenase large terminal subunit